MQIEVRPHNSMKVVEDNNGKPILGDDGKPVKVPHITDTQMIFVNGTHVGYCGHKPGMPVNLIIPNPPESFRNDIKEAVEEQLGGPVSKVSAPPAKPLPPLTFREEEQYFEDGIN